MTDVYTQESASKKKFLAPLLVILLCMVSLTAAGYAYSATVDNTDDEIVIDGVSLALYESDGSTLVKHAMFTVDDIHLATHTVNGKAANPAVGGKAFTDEDTAVAYNKDNLASYADGFYVEVLKGDARAGVNDVPAITDTETLAAAIAADNGMFAIGTTIESTAHTTYKLTVDRQTASNVTLEMNTKVLSATTPVAIKAILVVITAANGTTFVAIDTAAADDTFQSVATLSGEKGTTTYTVNAYVVLSDYYSATAPAATAYGAVDLEVSFKATA